MIVVSDTSPLRYLAVLGCLDLLPKLFTEVAIPRLVLWELPEEKAPAEARLLARLPPPWLSVYDESLPEDAALDLLDPGERAAILLAQRPGATLLLIDDEDGREAARQRGLAITGIDWHHRAWSSGGTNRLRRMDRQVAGYELPCVGGSGGPGAPTNRLTKITTTRIDETYYVLYR